MGRWIPKILIEWREPPDVRRWRDEQAMKALSPWFRPLLILLFLAAAIPVWFLRRELGGEPLRPLSIHVLMGIGFGLFACYGIPRMGALFGSRVWVSEQALSRSSGGSIVHHRHEKIVSCAIERRTFGTARLPVLMVRRADGPDSVLGIAAGVSLDELRRILTARGLRVTSGP